MTGAPIDLVSHHGEFAMAEPHRTPLPLLAPLSWLRRGAADLRDTNFRGVFYGLCFLGLALAIGWMHEALWQATMGLTAIAFLIGPFLCCGVYELSRQRERGEPPDLVASLTCWMRNLKSIALFTVLLVFCMIVWARVSVVMFALFASQDYVTLQGILRQIVEGSRNLEFLLVWSVVGCGFASLVFAVSVVSMPLLLDRQEDTVAAIAASVQALWRQPATCAIWAALIVGLVGGSLLLFLPAIVITGPWVAHATWHAYRALLPVEPSSAPSDVERAVRAPEPQ
ncbi:MAG: DUF2189 domain-containing protein [Burkholderiaceae bacterium]|nr:DUF2189 domain-containing protein [Burkholderiaceae bacterium]